MISSDQTADDAVAVTPSDTADNTFNALYVAAAGTLTIITPKGTTVSLGTVPAGTTVWIKTKIVKATGTTATVVGML